MSRLARAVGLVVSALSPWSRRPALRPEPVSPRVTAPTPPRPRPGAGTVFHDGFDGPQGMWPEQWHNMLWTNAAAQNGQGQLGSGHLSQIRTNTGWTLPAGTQVRVTASLLMPDTGSNYAAFWVQHPNGIDPREVDVIESTTVRSSRREPSSPHICYDATRPRPPSTRASPPGGRRRPSR